MIKLILGLLTLVSIIAPKLSITPEYVGKAEVIEIEQLDTNNYWTTILLEDGTKEYLMSKENIYTIGELLEIVVYDLYILHTNNTNYYLTAGVELHQLK